MPEPIEKRLVTEAKLSAELNPQSARLALLEGAAGFPAEPLSLEADVVRGLVSDPASVVGKALKATYGPTNGARPIGQGELVINVVDYGAKGNGIDDDTESIIAAEGAAYSLAQRTGANPRLFMTGRFKTTRTIQFRVDTDASQALIQYHGTGRAVQVGVDAPGVYTTDKEFHLPRVVKMNPPAGTWDGTSEGVVVTNVNQCRVWVPRVELFEKGLCITGNAAGTAYSEFYLGSLWVNRENLILDQGADGKGWVNQNQFYGGRATHSSSRGQLDDPKASLLRIGNESGFVLNPPDGNSFYGYSLEGRENRAKYRIKNYGRFNQFFNCRWESIGVTPVFHSYEYSGDNIIWGGYHADKLALTGVSGAVRVNSGVRGLIEATATNGQVIPSGAPTVITGWVPTASTTEPMVGGVFTPRAGRWKIFARVAFSANATGSRVTRLRQGSNIVDQHIMPGSGVAPASAIVEVTRRFNGTETLSVDVQQSSGVDLALVGAASYVRLYAEYLEP